MTTSNQVSNAAIAEIQPFRIAVEQADLDDLQYRLSRTRWPDALRAADWKYGVSLDYVKELASYWQNEYDWRIHEARLNEFPQFTTTVDGAHVHFLHVRSPEPDAFPLLLTHGWPSSIVEFLELIGPLSDPRSHGGDPANAFHLVIPSVPGFGFSGSTLEPGWNIARIARAWDTLMKRLGYEEYGAHGSDCGALVSRELGIQKPEGLRGVHVLQLFSFLPEIRQRWQTYLKKIRSVFNSLRTSMNGQASIRSSRPGRRHSHLVLQTLLQGSSLGLPNCLTASVTM